MEMTMDIEKVGEEALSAANQVQTKFLLEHGETAYCGFAWVNVKVTRTNSQEAKELTKIGFKKDYRPGMMQIWGPGDYNGQSMDIKETGARAYAEVLQKHGFKAYMGSRAD